MSRLSPWRPVESTGQSHERFGAACRVGFSSTGVTALASWSLHLCAYKWVAWAVLPADLILQGARAEKEAEGRLCGLLVRKRFSLVEREWDSQARERSLSRGPIVRRGRGSLHWYSSSGHMLGVRF